MKNTKQFIASMLLVVSAISEAFCQQRKEYRTNKGNITLLPDSSFSMSNSMWIISAGNWRKQRDTIFLTSKHRKGKIDSVGLIVKSKGKSDSVSIYVQTFFPVKLLMYDSNFTHKQSIIYPFCTRIARSAQIQYLKVVVSDSAASGYIRIPAGRHSSLSLYPDYPVYPEQYIFLKDDRYLLLRDSLVPVKR